MPDPLPCPSQHIQPFPRATLADKCNSKSNLATRHNTSLAPLRGASQILLTLPHNTARTHIVVSESLVQLYAWAWSNCCLAESIPMLNDKKHELDILFFLSTLARMLQLCFDLWSSDRMRTQMPSLTWNFFKLCRAWFLTVQRPGKNNQGQKQR